MAIKVLVVDDASFIRDLVKRTLRQQILGVESIEAGDGERGIALVKQQKPDLILSDWEMPKKNGEEFVRWLRSEPEYQDIPFIMITSRGDRNHVMEAVQAGVSDYISKPFSPEELIRKVTKQLKKLGIDAKVRISEANKNGNSSLDVLTGGKGGQAQAPKPAAKKPVKSGLLNAPAVPKKKGAIAKPPPVPGKKGAAAGGDFKGVAHLRFADCVCDCEVKDLSLQAVNVITTRPETVPRLFDQAAVDLEDSNGNTLAQLNAYVHSIQAVTPNPESEKIKVIVRFVDKDPAKMEALSKAIASA